MTLRLVPKLEGFELRDKRSDKNCDSTKWEKQDALYDASKEIEKADGCDAAIVIWRERYSSGSIVTRYRFSGQPDAAIKLLVSCLGKLMGWVE